MTDQQLLELLEKRDQIMLASLDKYVKEVNKWVEDTTDLLERMANRIIALEKNKA